MEPRLYIRVHAVVWAWSRGQTHRHTHTDRHSDARDQYTFRVVYDSREMWQAHEWHYTKSWSGVRMNRMNCELLKIPFEYIIGRSLGLDLLRSSTAFSRCTKPTSTHPLLSEVSYYYRLGSSVVAPETTNHFIIFTVLSYRDARAWTRIQVYPMIIQRVHKKRPPWACLKIFKISKFGQWQFNSMNICLFSIKLPIVVQICPTVTEILTFSKWS